ncbi:hybrid sensor histidine kinase/response regulator transcription factor [Dysgonomonas sp. 25]|uniref:hybrid sensor histidine kinase/response regulator transcription factor n=1 Tax=Dysgonomonas sp. 25 TaxID=2302933 RepID=UPI0013D259AD|nr:hybrid sensor histidine kinase/response regulator transcription factor [Dysgonomonas sp. 25]NDV67380.1 response regulator [Dysgonomonas sp. 25]
MLKRLLFLLLSLFSSFLLLPVHAYNLRKAPNSDSSGKSIRSIAQDSQGMIWLGTSTGAYRYNSKYIIPLNTIKGVRQIHATIGDQVFMETLYGLKEAEGQFYQEFNDIAFSASDSKGNYFLLQDNNNIYYKMKESKDFANIRLSGLRVKEIKTFFIDDTDVARVVMQDGRLRNFDILYTANAIALEEKPEIKLAPAIIFSFTQDNHLYFIDNNYILLEFRSADNQQIVIQDLGKGLLDKGDITSAVFFKEEFYFGTEKGLYVIMDEGVSQIMVNKQVNCLLKDKFQESIWIGTDTEGLYTYSYDRYAIKNNLLSGLHNPVTKPVTAIYMDEKNTLWLGTEGEGIIKIPNYSFRKGTDNIYSEHISERLPDDTIYSFHGSEHGIWIGCKSGLAFYSKKLNRIIPLGSGNNYLKHIKAIYQQGSTLWVACYEAGIAKVEIASTENIPELSSIRFFTIDENKVSRNRFSSIFTMHNEVCFINRSNGIYKIENDRLIEFPIPQEISRSANRIIAANDNSYIAATDFGIAEYNHNYEVSSNSVLNNTDTKDILPGYEHHYWLSTCDGLSVYNREVNSFQHFDESYGLNSIEYLSNSSFKDERSGLLFFGGINGFTTILYVTHPEITEYMPTLKMEKLSLFGINRNINDFRKENTNELIFGYNQNFFTLTFLALDYLHGSNYNYYYKIGDDGQWVNNNNDGAISFTNMNPGRYELYVKYHNKDLHRDSDLQRISIIILPPWYRSGLAYFAYFLILAFVSVLFIRAILKLRRRKKAEESARAMQQKKEEIYEAKLDFFTDIAHEFATPLTLISGPCNRILEQKGVSPLIAEYINVINLNAKRMNSLIKDLMDFKQIDAGYKKPQIRKLDVSNIANNVIDSFKVGISTTAPEIEKSYDREIVWNSDEKFLTTIFINLLSNAVKYSEGEVIKFEVLSNDKELKIRTSNRSKTIHKEDIKNIFDRYTVFSKQKNKSWQQNGLGLAITAGLVRLLSGKITAEILPDNIIAFTITLPFLKGEESIYPEVYSPPAMNTNTFKLAAPQYEYKNERPTVTIIDDDEQVLWLIGDILKDDFNIFPVNDPLKALNLLSTNHTDIIICDMMMKGIDGIDLTKVLKSDKMMSHIPLIIVSAVHEAEKQIEVIDSGADVFITKPFDNDYLKSVVFRLLMRKTDLKEYFTSPLSEYKLDMGKLQHADDRKLVKQLHKIINKNIHDENLSSDFIATSLGMSTRSLYRRLKEINISLHEMIRNGRLLMAKNLLLKSKLTIDEIVTRSGFSNKSSFYRAFSQRYGCKPTEFRKNNGQE